MGELVGEIVPLALGAAISPLVLTAMLLTLSTGERRLARGAALAAGAGLPLLILGLAGIAIFSHTVPSEGTGSHSGRSALIDLGLGLVLLALAVRQVLRGRSRNHQDPAEHRPPASQGAGLGRSALLGSGMMVTNFSTAVLFIAALKLIGRADVDLPEQLVALALLMAVTLIPATVPLASYALAPRPASRVLDPLGAWVGGHRRAVALLLLLGFGAYLTVKGITAL